MKMVSQLIALSFLLLTSCKKDNSPNSTIISYFPNTVGNKYTYAVTDSVNNMQAVVNVAVTGSSTVSGKPVKVWVYTYPNYIDTNYVFSNKDSVVIYDKTKTTIDRIYLIPFNVGSKWRGPLLSDSCKVVSYGSLMVQSGSYSDTYLIIEHIFGPNYHLTRNQWFVPKLGFVKMEINEFNLGPTKNQTWELIKYNVNPN